jgi:hypothetical protein
MHDDRRSMTNDGIPLIHLLTERVSLDTYYNIIHSNENNASLIIKLIISAYFVQSELCNNKREILIIYKSCNQRK